MKNGAALTLSIAAFSLVLLAPKFDEAQNAQSAEPSQGSQSTAASDVQSQAAQMVVARAALIENLDARTAKLGQQFRAKLSDTVHLKNGPELPHGTVLVGEVTADDMQNAGTSKLALRFTQAQPKHGKAVPIKATIVGVFPPQSEDSVGNTVAVGDEPPDSWNDRIVQIDQVGVLSGVDLHSKIGGANSGVFVSSKKDDVKLRTGSELTLAVAAQGSGQMSMNP